jgi:hypothetical protein
MVGRKKKRMELTGGRDKQNVILEYEGVGTKGMEEAVN